MKGIGILFLVFQGIICFGQNYIFQNQHYFKPYLINPALAGANRSGNAMLVYSKRLIGFENAPNSQLLSIDYPFPKNQIGLGINGFKDQNGAVSFVGLESTFAYHLQSEGRGAKKPLTGLSFGISATYNQYRIDRLGLLAGNVDNNLFTDDTKFFNAYPNANVGFHFHSHGFHLGISAYNIIPQVNDLFMNENDVRNAFLTFISSGVKLNPMGLIPTNRREFFTYAGSLTTPPCSEGINFYIFKQPITISADQLAALKAIYSGNNRTPQDLNGRVISSKR
jgi:type IX secretion system PorP/SprF family membrane protein